MCDVCFVRIPLSAKKENSVYYIVVSVCVAVQRLQRSCRHASSHHHHMCAHTRRRQIITYNNASFVVFCVLISPHTLGRSGAIKRKIQRANARTRTHTHSQESFTFCLGTRGAREQLSAHDEAATAARGRGWLMTGGEATAAPAWPFPNGCRVVSVETRRAVCCVCMRTISFLPPAVAICSYACVCVCVLVRAECTSVLLQHVVGGFCTARTT